MVRSYRLFDDPEFPSAYRAMTVTGDGRVMANLSLFAGSDLEAIAAAKVLAYDQAVELWDDLCFIDRFEAGLQRPEFEG
ncbi:hypothetical protein [Methylobacterium sp. J-070]|uniref:hypothetical protein n=1 Tax=Methylobacterium sp. J-070 TaxID=2836650 RepID=UPI001FBBA1F0|nr:hypothetical protein [Methylobacterium sp. J-070]MCJ2050668.1 hypothetical protein [Methylobacterium sp. J-070]